MARTTYGPSVYRPAARASAGQSFTSGVTYTGSLAVDVYRPGGLTGMPAVAVVHGGGWVTGDKTDAGMVSTSRRLADAGFCAFSANYTLVPGGNTSANYRVGGSNDLVAEIRTLIQWIRDNAATYGVDATKVAALGFSAGAQLSLMAGCLGTPGEDQPDAVASWSAPTRFPTHDGLATEAVIEVLIGDPLAGNETVWQDNSPYHRVTSTCCPLRIVNSASEDPATGGIQQSQADDMHTAALAAGVDATKAIYAGTQHSDFRTIDLGATIEWLWSRIGGRPTPARAAASARVIVSSRLPV